MEIRKPYRATRSFTQTIDATPERVFPLYCPVREVDWVPGWAPPVVISESGVAELDCVFTTQAGHGESLWFITVHEPASGRVEMIKHTPGLTVNKLRIEIEPLGTEKTSATISYSLTALSRAGEHEVDAFSEAHYTDFMRAWAAQMNHYLATGGVLAAPD